MKEFEDMSPLANAIAMVAYCFDGMLDKGGTPIIMHIMHVMCKGKTDQERILGLLHEAIEDLEKIRKNIGDEVRGKEELLEDIQELFGNEMIEALDAISRRPGEEYEAYIERCSKNDLSAKVKIYDLDHNMDITRIPNPTKKDLERVEKYKEAKAYLLATLGW